MTLCQGGPEGPSSKCRRSVKEVSKVFCPAGTELMQLLVGRRVSIPAPEDQKKRSTCCVVLVSSIEPLDFKESCSPVSDSSRGVGEI